MLTNHSITRTDFIVSLTTIYGGSLPCYDVNQNELRITEPQEGVAHSNQISKRFPCSLSAKIDV